MAAVDIEALARSVGIPTDLVKSGLGAVLNYLKAQLPGDTFAQVQAGVPEAQPMMDSAAQSSGSGSGLLGSLTGALTNLLGAGKGAGELLSKLNSLGFSPEQIAAFLPKVLEFFKSILPSDLLPRVLDALKKGS